MTNGNDLEKIKKERDNLKKQKIIMQAKLKQKEDKITDLNQKVRELQINAKESGGNQNLAEKIDRIEEEIARSKKVNKQLRSENNRLMKELEETKKELKSARQQPKSESKLEAVSVPGQQTQANQEGPSAEELEYLRGQLQKKDNTISQLTEQLQMINPQQMANVGGSYMKVRKLNAKIRELKGQVELAKKSEASMKERLLQMEREKARDDDLMKW